MKTVSLYRSAKANYHYIFFALFLLLISIGSYFFLHEGIQTSHFSAISVRALNETSLVTDVFISGQYKTIEEGFFVGKKITISRRVRYSEPSRNMAYAGVSAKWKLLTRAF